MLLIKKESLFFFLNFCTGGIANYDEPRQCVEKQRHYSADKGLIVKAMIFPVVT